MRDVDASGSTAGTQTGFSAYGQSTANRVQIDGVNTTEGTSAAGFYMDYGAFEEIQLGVDSNDASMPVPGVAFRQPSPAALYTCRTASRAMATLRR